MPPQESSLGFRYLAWWLNPSCGPESWGGLGGWSGFIKCVQFWWPESWWGLGGDQEVWTAKSIKFRPPRSLRSLGNRTASLRSARTLRVLERRYASCQFICLRSVHTLWNVAAKRCEAEESVWTFDQQCGGDVISDILKSKFKSDVSCVVPVRNSKSYRGKKYEIKKKVNFKFCCQLEITPGTNFLFWYCTKHIFFPTNSNNFWYQK